MGSVRALRGQRHMPRKFDPSTPPPPQELFSTLAKELLRISELEELTLAY